jgi:hypothetical protein
VPRTTGAAVTLVAVAPKRNEIAFVKGQEWAPTHFVIRELREALTRTYYTSAHVAPYVVEGLALDGRQCRIKKAGLELYMQRFGARVFTHVFLCDIDNPGHGDWTDDLFERAREQDRTLSSLATAGVYYTPHGRRAVQPLTRSIDVRETEAHLAAWLRQLEADGLQVDWRCKDWTRLYRLPNVPPFKRSRCIDLDRMVPIELPELPPAPPGESVEHPGRARARAPRAARGAWTESLPDAWRPIAAAIAPAVAEVTTEWHSLFMALAGALLSRRVPPEHVPALCHAISVLTGRDDRTEDRVAGARTSAERWLQHLPTTGYTSLAREWPDVAAAFDEALASRTERRMRDQLAPASDVRPPTLAETTGGLENALRAPPDGLLLIQAGCGIGKTRAAERVAAERAAKPYATKDATGQRAPPQSKTGISVDKHTLVKQVVRHLDVLGAPAAWHHGPLAKLDDEGRPVCKLAEVAGALVAGGQPMQWVLCRGRDIQPCEHFDGCTAKDGYEGPEHARVHVGPHALLSRLNGQAGSSGLLIIDEPPPLLETLTFTPTDFATTFGMLDAFDGAYSAALRPALEAVGAWLTTGAIAPAATTVAGVVTAFAQVIDGPVLAQARRSAGCPDGDALACARAAPVADEGPPAPPVRLEHLTIAKKNPAHARRLGAASSVLRAVHHALTSEAPVAVRLEVRNGRRVLHLTRVREAFFEALRREGSVVVLDANIDIWAPLYAKVVGYVPPILRFEAPDGAPIERTVHRLTGATRSNWLRDGKLQLAPSLRTAIRAAIAWASERPGNGILAIIAIHVVELALRAALAPDDRSVDDAWERAGQDAATLALVRAELGPLVREWKGEVLFGHYGALRGLDAMADADNLVTLGDPWVNVDQVRHECAFLGLTDWDARLEAMCRAELEQAHGRLRTVHRTRPARALHVGAVAPGGAEWSRAQVAVRRAAPGPPKRAGGSDDELLLSAVLERLGSVSELAGALRCEPRSVRRYLAGERALPGELRLRLRELRGPDVEHQ